MLHLKAIRTSPYHLQTDGLVERINCTLKAMLRKTITGEGKDWIKALSYIALCLLGGSPVDLRVLTV